MNGNVFLFGTGLVLAGWFIHLLWWRVARPKDDLKALAVCLLLVPAVLSFAILLFGWLDSTGWFLTVVLALGLGTAYIFWYPAAQAASPTMLITILAYQAGKDGITESMLKDRLSEKVLSGNSIDSLLHEKFARQDGGEGLVLAPRGRRTLTVIQLLRRSAGFHNPKG